MPIATACIRAITLARAGLAFGVHAAFPRGCAACDAPLPLRTLAAFCPPCAATVEALPDDRGRRDLAGVAVVAFAVYGGALAQALQRLKYAGRADLGAQLGGLLGRVAPGVRADLVVPVPLHPLRLAARGYNQAALLARALADATGGRFAPDALARLRDTPQQTRLARAARAENMAGAFSARRARVAGARVALVDDVVTTGATLCACAEALLEAGACEVTAAVLACAE